MSQNLSNNDRKENLFININLKQMSVIFQLKLGETIVKTTKNVHKLVVIYHRKLTIKMAKLVSSDMIDFNKLLLKVCWIISGIVLENFGLLLCDLNNSINQSFNWLKVYLLWTYKNILFMLLSKTENLKTQSVGNMII